MQKEFEDLWKIFPDNSLKGRTWHWWWWLFFFENPERPEYPRQLMILWGTRNCKKVRINDFLWLPAMIPKVQENHAEFESVVASWYCDGEKTHEPFILEKGATETDWGDGHGSIKMESERGSYTFHGKDADFTLKAENPNVGVDLRMVKWNDEMAKLIPTGRVFLGNLNMGYTMLKYRALLTHGKIRQGDETIDVKGRAYFQKVRISSITPSWYWATIQWDSGAYMQYFLLHAGIPMLRQQYSHNINFDWGEKFIGKTLNFYDPNEKKEHQLKDVQVSKRYENDLPIFKVTAKDGDIKLMAEMATYGRCCWNITQPLIWPFWLGVFYNEYPARLIDFKYRNGSKKYGMEDMGKCYCNCEHTWGAV